MDQNNSIQNQNVMCLGHSQSQSFNSQTPVMISPVHASSKDKILIYSQLGVKTGSNWEDRDNSNTPVIKYRVPDLSFLPVPEVETSPSPMIRMLSHGTNLLSSGLEEGIGIRESISSQILIRDEIVSRFNEDDSGGVKSPIFDKSSTTPADSTEKLNNTSELRITSPPAEQSIQRALVTIEANK